jgi:hypothetical protein
MKWIKRGLIYTPTVAPPLMISHACLPLPLRLRDDIYRVFFGCRDDRNCTHVWFIEVRLGESFEVLRVSDRPVLSPGPIGTHDEHGVYPSSIVHHDGMYYLYTSCWNRGERPPMNYNSIGLALSEDGETFRRYSPAPILQRSEHDPCFVAMPMVLRESGRWRMWYSSGFKWTAEKDQLHSYYDIKYAESADGIDWKPTGRVAFDHVTAEEKNLARPWIIREPDRYRAWLSYSRGAGYRIGYAESRDGLNWQRHDQRAGIGLSDSGWDSEMICHPAVVQQNGRWFMFYNGNRFARDGIGLAVADSLD